MRKIGLFVLFVFAFSINSIGQIYLNQFTGTAACPTQGNVPVMAANSTGTPVTRSTVTCTPLVNAFNSTTLNVTSAISNTSYIEFSATANAGFQLNVTSLSFFRQGSNSAPNQIEVRYSTDGFATFTTWGAAPVTPLTGNVITWDFPDFTTAVGGNVSFRIYPYGTTRCDLGTPSLTGGTFRVDDVTINGTVTSASPPTVTITAQDPNTPTAVDWGTGTTGNIFYWASLSPTLSNAVLSSVTANMSGTYQAADIQTNGLKLYYSADFTFTAGAPDVLLGQQSSAKAGATENITWTGLTQSIAQNGTGYIYAVADIAPGATAGRTVAGTFTNDGNIVFNPVANYSPGNTYGAVTNKTIIQNPTNPTTFAVSCASEARINVNLNTPTAGTVLVFANTTGTFTAPTGAGSSFTGANSVFSAAANYPAVGGRLVYSGPGANFSLTGLTAGSTYHLRAYSFINSVWSSGTATINGTATTQPVTGAGITAGDQQLTLNWTNPGATSCFNNVIIIARAGAPVEAVVSKATFDGLVSDAEFTGATSVWTSNNNLNDVYDLTLNLVGTDNTNFLVYKGTGNSVNLTGLTNNTTYYYSIFTIDGSGSAARWSNVVNISGTPVLANVATDFFRSNSNNTGAGGSWNTASNWQYSADNGATIPWQTATLVPNLNSAGITIRNNHNIALSSGSITADQLTVDASATLTVNGGQLTINNGAGTDLTVNGTFTFSSGNTIYSPGYTVSFGALAAYNHNVNGGTIPASTWNLSSICTVTGMIGTWPLNIAQNYGNFTWSCTGQTSFVTISNPAFSTQGTLRVTASGASSGVNLNNTANSYTFTFGAIEVTGGILEFSYLPAAGFVGLTTVKVAGDVSVSGTGTIEFAEDLGGAVLITGGSYAAVMEMGGNLSIGTGTGFKASGTNYGLVLFSRPDIQTYTGPTASANINFGIDYAIAPVSSLTLASALSLDGLNGDVLSNNGSLTLTGTFTVRDDNGGTTGAFYQNGNDIINLTGTLTTGSNEITTVSSTAAVDIGMSVAGTGIPANTYIIDFTANSIVLSNNASASGAVNFTVTSAGRLIVSAGNGITATSVSGAVQVEGTRFYSSTADYEFRGNNTGNFATITSPVLNTVRNLTINNPTAVTLTTGTNITVNGALNLISGTFWVNGNILTINGTIPSPAGNINNNSLAGSTVVFNISNYTINPGLFTPSGEVQNITNNPGIGNTNTLNGNFIFNNTLNLQSGILNNGNNSLTFRTGNTPIIRSSGTLTMGASSSLTFGTAGNTGGTAFQIPDGTFTSAPVISNMTVNRTNQLTLGNQGMQLTGSLTLTLGTLNIGPNTLLDLNGASLTAPGGFLTGNAIAGSTSDFTVRGTTGGTVTIPQNGNIGIRTLTVGGTRYVSMNGTNNINLSNTLTVASGATFDTGGDASQVTSSGSPTVVVDGRFITRHPGGFNGGGTAITSAAITLNTGSIVEYGRLGDQSVQGSTSPGYRNVTFSGSGTKTLLSATTGIHPIGTVYITNSAIFDQSIFTFGDANTNLNMDNGRHRLSGTGTKPDIDGSYNLTGGIIEFYNNSGTAQTVKATNNASASIMYNAIEITGSNVGQSNGNINLRTNGTFTVTSTGIFTNNSDAIVGPIGTQTLTIATGGRFITGNALGFYGAVSGLNSPSVRDNIETIVLQPNSTIEYSRATAQNFTPIATSPVTNYQNVVISGGGGKNLTGAVSMEGVLTLTNGLVNTTSTNILTLTATATNPGTNPGGGSLASFINGPMRKIGTANFIFPVGKPVQPTTTILPPNSAINTGGYRPIGISGLSASETFEAEYHLSNPYIQGPISANATGAGLQAISRCEYWDLTKTGTATATVTLSWSTNSLGQSQCNIGSYINNTTAAVVVPYYNGQWGDQNPDYFGQSGSPTLPVASSESIGTISWDGTTGIIDSYQKFVIGTINWQLAPLPFDLTVFNATGKNKQVQLDWTVNNNQQIKEYTLERSRDGQRFAFFKTVSARAQEQRASYTDLDPAPFAGWNYYRLKAVTHSGEVFYSDTRKVNMGQQAEIGLSPNPARNILTIRLPNAGAVTELTISNSVGQVLRQLKPTADVLTVDLSAWPSGVYYVRMISATDVIVKPFVKE